MPGESGTYCALTGERLKAADALATGIATHHVASDRWRDLVAALCGREPVDAVLGVFHEPMGLGPLTVRHKAVDALFALDRVEDILATLDDEAISGSDRAGFAGATAALIRSKSPTSLKLALAQVRRGRKASFTDCMKMEFRIVSHVVHGHDFYEGVRALIIDKDRQPRWHPATIEEVDDATIAAHFAPLAAGELELP
jgi:enoyl-CoA hydratase